MTKLLYLHDTYLKESIATIKSVGEYEGKKYLILDQTIFYAQGGGQPSDVGTITTITGVFEVQKCLFLEGEVYHYGELVSGEITAAQDAQLLIDWDKRILNARYHTAGHLLEDVLNTLYDGYSTVKGFCFPEGAYMEFTGGEPLDKNQSTVLEDAINKAAREDHRIFFEFVEDQKHDSGKPMRVVHIEGLSSCPCGGTHLSSTSQIGSIAIRKVKRTGETFRISYAVVPQMVA
jgi:alanyl-tRNA synthetase